MAKFKAFINRLPTYPGVGGGYFLLNLRAVGLHSQGLNYIIGFSFL